MAAIRELTLDEMLADPIVHLVMARDGVAESEVRSLIDQVSAWFQSALPAPLQAA